MHISAQAVRNAIMQCLSFRRDQFKVNATGANNINVELMRPSGDAATVVQTHNFQGYRTTGMNVRVRPGVVRADVPSNMTIEVEVPPNQTDGYFVWVRADRTGDHYSDGCTSEIQHGATLPTPPTSSGGLPPAWTFYPLFYVVTGDDAIISINQIVFSNLWIKENPIQSCLETEYDLEWVQSTFASGG